MTLLVDSRLHRNDPRESLCPRCRAELDPENFWSTCGATAAFRGCSDPEAEWMADQAAAYADRMGDE